MTSPRSGTKREWADAPSLKGQSMCGIAGYKSSQVIEHHVLEAMVESLHHRGPDSAGFYRTPQYSAGMRRLSINDLTTGEQPLYNEEKSVVLLYNGEIYNSPQLRRDLETRGHRFRTHSDGEVICHLWEEHGEDLFEYLDGMFAAALWIVAEQKLILARDLPGEKPLYFARLSGQELVFGSEIKSLLKHPLVDRTLNKQALWDFPSFLWVPEPETVFRSVQAVPRGHLLIADARGIRLRPYQNRFNTGPIDQSDEGVIAETKRVVTEAVRSRLLSDVPIGCFLSGGLDSSIVTTIAAQATPRLATFTIGFEDLDDPYHGRANESEQARWYADRLGTEHHNIPVTGRDFREALREFSIHGDQPFSVSSGLGILAIAKAARKAGIKVLLSGDGADECFGGYSWYFHLARVTAARQQAADDRPEVSLQDLGDLSQRLETLAGYSAQKRAWALHYYASESDKASLYNRDYFASESEPATRHFTAWRPDQTWSPENYIAQDRAFYFPYEMLRKVDRMTMAASVEGRVPFAAPAVLAHADKLQYRHMVRGDSLKWALREAFRDALPPEVINRPKHGFNVPIDHWLSNDWADLVDDTFAPDSALSRLGVIHAGSGAVARAMLADRNRLCGHTILSFIMLNLWLGS